MNEQGSTPRYSASDQIWCPKCGKQYSAKRAEFADNGTCMVKGSLVYNPHTDLLELTCQLCGYTWPMQPQHKGATQ